MGRTWESGKPLNAAPVSLARRHQVHKNGKSPGRRQSCTDFETSFRLTRIIETEIVPRLLVAHRQPTPEAAIETLSPAQADVVELARLSVEGETEDAVAFVARLREAGIPLESLYLQLLTPAARLLGRLWEEDRCSFLEVTIGLGRLQQIVHHFGADFFVAAEAEGCGLSAMVASMPDEQHRFGISILEEFLSRDGWDVHNLSGAPANALRTAVHDDWFDMIGLSASCDSQLPKLAVLVKSLRDASCNRRALIMVGGRAVHDDPEIVRQLGADLTASDGQEAVTRARSLLTHSAFAGATIAGTS
jgi:methanogenic corrinoid protein MtbC1